jgi:phosphatidylglycerophosphatase A
LLGEHDFNGIVWDEVAGYLVTLWFVPLSWEAVFIGFVLFRFFDILKPFPIKWVDKHVHGGFGIMFDDILAGIFAGSFLLAFELLGIKEIFST